MLLTFFGVHLFISQSSLFDLNCFCILQQNAKRDRRGEELNMDKLTLGERRAIEGKPRSGRKK